MARVKSRLLAATLRPGTVYLMPHRGLTSPLPHFLAVVNRDPRSDTVILLSVVTSNIAYHKEKARVRGHPAHTVVEFGPADYAPLSHPSCIDCNEIQTMPAEEFERKVLTRVAIPKDDLPAPVLARVIAGILDSPRVRPEFKALVQQTPPKKKG